MLTPGEFVMNNKAVKKYGVNAMQRLNKGQFEGFNKGGFVGGGSVIYKADGGEVGAKTNIGTLTVDGSGLQSIFDNFGTKFSDLFKPLTSGFDSMVKAISGVADKISSASIVFQHNITGSISVDGLNTENIVSAITSGIEDQIKAAIQQHFDEDHNTFKSGN